MGFTAEIEADEPILWAPLGEEETFYAADISGYGRNGDYRQNIAGDMTFGLPALAPRLPGTSINLGIAGYVTWPAASWQRDMPLSAEIWFIRNPWSGSDSLVNLFGLYLYTGIGQGWSLGIYRDSTSLNISGRSEHLAFSDNWSSGVTAGVVHQAVITMDPVTFDVDAYLDGQYAGTTNVGEPIINDPCQLVVGGRLDTAPNQHADNTRVQHAMLFDRVLSADRVLAHWLAGTRLGAVPPCQLYPRDDDQGVGSGAIWPPPSSQQAGIPGGYY